MGSHMSGEERAKRRGGGAKRDPLANLDQPSKGDPDDAYYAALCKLSVKELLDKIAESGWMLNNLFQIGGKQWRANVRFIMEMRDEVRTYFHEFSDAGTPEEALAGAIWNMEQRRNAATRLPGAKNRDTDWDPSMLPNARKIEGSGSAHRPGEVLYKDEWKPEVERELFGLWQDLVKLRTALSIWRRSL